MKVISGKYKGRVVKGYDLEGTRPTMDRVKESLFGTIQEYINNSIVLDLFSGSGNLGIESLSEGAKFAYLVDNNSNAVNIIKDNIKKIGIEDVEIIKKDYIDALAYLKDKEFNIIFLDPPYKTDYIEKSIILIEKYNLLKDKGIIICESDSLEKIKYSSTFKEIKRKKYGDKFIVILEKI